MTKEQQRDEDVWQAGLTAGTDAVNRLGPDLARNLIIEEASRFLSLSPYQGTPSAIKALVAFADGYQCAAYRIKNQGAEPKRDVAAARRAGENAFHVYGPNQLGDQLWREARCIYSFEIESASFYFGYCAAHNSAQNKDGAPPEQPSTSSDVITSEPQLDINRLNDAYRDGVAALNLFGPTMSERFLSESAAKRWSSPDEQKAYMTGYRVEANRAGYPNAGRSEDSVLGRVADKANDYAARMRFGRLFENMQEWRREHPEATEEQATAAAQRYVALANSNLGSFRRGIRAARLLKRTDLDTSF
jgi:hypothetical protein